MARPTKNSVDYFPHDADMRNHKKIKSIRQKFGVLGYAVWSMILEHMAGSDGNVFEYSDMEFELMSGDFGVSATEIRNVVDYCISLEMLFGKDGFIHSPSLDERLAPVYQKRGKAKELSAKQKRVLGKFAAATTDPTVVSVTETPQSKVKEIKVKEIFSTRNVFELPEQAYEALTSDNRYFESTQRILTNRGWRTCNENHVRALLYHFLEAKADMQSDRKDLEKHFKNWLASSQTKIPDLTEIANNINSHHHERQSRQPA